MSSPLPQIGPQLEVGSDFVSIDSLVIQNTNLAAILLDIKPEERIAKLLEIIGYGTETYQLFSTTAAAEALKSVASGIASEMTTKKEEIVSGVNQIAKELSAESGSLSIKALLENWRHNFSELLKDNFDPTNTESILAKFDTLITEKAKTQSSEVVNRLSFDVEGSVVNQLQANLRKHVTDEFERMKTELDVIKTRLRIDDANKGGTQHGRDLNANMDALLQQLATESGDSPLYTNDIPTESGSKVGDEVITIDPNFTNGHDAKTVWEFKAVQKVTVPAALAELSEAMENRKAQAGVFVLARTTHNASWARFTAHPGRRAIIVVDEDDIDPLLVHYAHIWSRIEAVRSFGTKEATIDFDKLHIAVEDAKKALDGLSQVVAGHTGIQNNLDHAVKWISSSQRDLKAEFQNILELSKPSIKGE